MHTYLGALYMWVLCREDGEVTAVHAAAAQGGGVMLLEFLLQNNAAFERPDPHGRTPLHYAIIHDNHDIAKVRSLPSHPPRLPRSLHRHRTHAASWRLLSQTSCVQGCSAGGSALCRIAQQ